MEELLASLSQKKLSLIRGQEVEGEVVSVTEKEVTLDLGTKAEGVISLRDLGAIKIGDKAKVFVVEPENESGQVVLSAVRQFKQTGKYAGWNKFNTALSQKSKLTGKVMEVNKGGLIVEIEGVRGFLPTSQVNLTLIGGKKIEDLIDQNIEVLVIEIDQYNNRLIFSQKDQISDAQFLEDAKKYQTDDVIKGTVSSLTSSGVYVALEDGLEGFIPANKLEGIVYQIGQQISALVDSIDQGRKRVNLAPFLTTTKGLIYK